MKRLPLVALLAGMTVAVAAAAVAAPPSVPPDRSGQGGGPRALDTVVGASWTRALTQVTWPNRDGHATVVFAGKLWVLGGWGAGPLNDVWASVDAIHWDLVTAEAPWAPRKGHTALVFRDRIWILGGSLGAETTGDVWSSADGREWRRETAEAPWGKRHNHASAVFRGRIWVIGGLAGDWSGEEVNDVWSSADGVHWRKEGAAPFPPRNGHAAAVLDDRLYVLAGWGKTGDKKGNLNDVWSTRDGRRWERATARAPWALRNHQSVAVYDGRLWVLGGWGTIGPQEGNLNDVWSTRNGKDWQAATAQAPWLPRNGHTSAVFDGKLWILGGWSQHTGGTSVNDLWWAGAPTE